MSYLSGTKIFAGHDLVDYALGVAKNLDPANPGIISYWESYNPEMELKVNPFVHYNDNSLDEYRKKLNMPLNTHMKDGGL